MSLSEGKKKRSALLKRNRIDGDTPSSLTQRHIGGNHPTVFRNPFYIFSFTSSASFDVFITTWKTIPDPQKYLLLRLIFSLVSLPFLFPRHCVTPTSFCPH